jgi:hypothetical protein
MKIDKYQYSLLFVVLFNDNVKVDFVLLNIHLFGFPQENSNLENSNLKSSNIYVAYDGIMLKHARIHLQFSQWSGAFTPLLRAKK